jgi:hypothetical protein
VDSWGDLENANIAVYLFSSLDLLHGRKKALKHTPHFEDFSLLASQNTYGARQTHSTMYEVVLRARWKGGVRNGGTMYRLYI